MAPTAIVLLCDDDEPRTLVGAGREHGLLGQGLKGFAQLWFTSFSYRRVHQARWRGNHEDTRARERCQFLRH